MGTTHTYRYIIVPAKPTTTPILLWTNPDINSSFSNTTLSINVTPYEYIIISVQGLNDPDQICLVPVDQIPLQSAGTILYYVISQGRFISGGARYGFTRGIYKTSSSLTISNCYREQQEYNAHCKPYKIYGINNLVLT